MYIISKYKDYYDGVVQSTGIDKQIVFNRNTEEVDKKDYPSYFSSIDKYFSIKQEDLYYFPFIIGFCGKIYCGYQTYKDERFYAFDDPNNGISYDLDLVDDNTSWYRRKYTQEFKEHNERENFEPFLELNVPIFSYFPSFRNEHLFKNPRLNDYKFFKVIDSWTAFQEIQMFVSGVLTNNDEAESHLTDEQKAANHGFDKWTFRNPDPPKRKRKSKRFKK